MTLTHVREGFSLGLARARTPVVAGVAAVVLLVGVVAAVLERRGSPIGASGRVLGGSLFGYVVPLLALAALVHTLDRGQLDKAATALARFGASRRAVALGLLACSMAAAALGCVVLTAVAVVVARDPAGPPLVRDAFVTGGIALITACAYTAIFALGSTLGRRGGGMWAFAVLDFLFGNSGTVFGLLFPRGHAQNLLGTLALSVSQPASFGLLVAITVVGSALALWRCPP